MKIKKQYLLAGVGLVLLLVLAIAIFGHVAPPSVKAVQAVKGPATQVVYATGTVEATVMLPIATRAAARLVELNVDEGSKVEKDQLLARLEDEDLQSSVVQVRAQERYSRDEYQRTAQLLSQGYATKDAADRSKADWDAAKAAVARAEAQVNFMRLTSPAEGQIIRRDGEIGQLIPANQPVFWISCCAPLRITAEVDEEDIALVQPGQEVLIRADAFPGKTYMGKVESITPKGDPVARSYRVRITFSEETPLLIGMTTETNILVRSVKDALLLPASTVIQDKVWLIKEDVLVEQKVEVGAKGTDKVEIISGIRPEDVVVLEPEVALKAGDKVRASLQAQGNK